MTKPTAYRYGIRYGLPALALVTLFGSVGCGKKPAAAKTADSGATAGIAVNADVAVTQDIDKSVDVTGSLVALQDVVVGAKLAGKLSQVYVHEGDMVTAGQTVATMDTSDYLNQVTQANAGLLSAKTRVAQAQAQLAQSRTALKQAEMNLRLTDQTTKTGVAVAEASLETAQERLSTVKEGARAQERQQAQENLNSAKANYDKARADLKRYQDLFRKQAISASQLDQAQAGFDAAQASYNSALQALSLIKEGARPQDIRQAELAVQQAKDSLTKAKADRENVALRAEDVTNAKANIASAVAGLESAKAAVTQNLAMLKIAQDAVANASIKSPISGIVATRIAEPGSQLGSGGAVARIVNPGSVYFQAVLSESQYNQVRMGQKVNVTVDALPNHSFYGRITRILPVASAARSFTVRIDIAADNMLRPQMFARGSILIDTHKNATVVNKDAVIYGSDSEGAKVFAVTNGVAEARKVQVGYSNPKFVEIRSGVQAGEKVVTVGKDALQNGDKVRVQ